MSRLISTPRAVSAAQIAIALLLAAARPAAGQFVTVIPRPLSDSIAMADALRGAFDRRVSAALKDSLFASSPTLTATEAGTRLTTIRTQFCRERVGIDSIALNICFGAVDLDSIQVRKTTRPGSETRVFLKPRLPFAHRRGDITEYLRHTTGGETVKLFSRFAANVSDKEAYVVTDVISGLTGRILFAINYAAVVVKDDSADSTRRKALEDDKATVMRMINNGGTIAARFQLPIHAQAGPTGQSASSIYGTAGLIGPLGRADSLEFAGSVNGEFAMALTIRDIAESAGFLGDLILAGRVGYAFSESALVSGMDDKGLPYAQFAVGLRQNASLSLSALVTWALKDEFKPLTPKLIVNFAAIR